jgi:hypothetical protein
VAPRDLAFRLVLNMSGPGSTQSVTQISTRNLPGGKGRPARETDSLTAICEPTSEPYGSFAFCCGDDHVALRVVPDAVG